MDRSNLDWAACQEVQGMLARDSNFTLCHSIWLTLHRDSCSNKAALLGNRVQ